MVNASFNYEQKALQGHARRLHVREAARREPGKHREDVCRKAGNAWTGSAVAGRRHPSASRPC